MAYNSHDRAQRELEAIQAKSNMLTDESLESTRRMVQLTQETQEVGAATMVTLDEQGEKLNRIQDGMETINQDVRTAEKSLTQMEKCCGLCLCPCNRSKDYDKDARHAAAFSKGKRGEDADVVNSQPGGGAGRTARGTGAAQPTVQPRGGHIQRITNDAREDEMDQNIDLVSQAVGNLKNMALDMGDTLEQQNKQLDDINEMAEMNQERIRGAHERAKAINRKA